MGRATDWPRAAQADQAAAVAIVERETTAATAALGRRWLRELAALPAGPDTWPEIREAVRRRTAHFAARADPAADIAWAFWDSAGEVMDLLARRQGDPDKRWRRFLTGLRDAVASAERDLAAQGQARPN